uniref:Uncharacterized protein n=1 Tax=Solanum lycopersicum TaxID=4081 RepID=A0A3Q7J338_SOLLC
MAKTLCKITLPPDNYLATYSKKIRGKIVENRIAELDGISVRAFFKWWGITGIRSSGENLVFEVGMGKSIPLPENSTFSIEERIENKLLYACATSKDKSEKGICQLLPLNGL